MRYQLLLTLLFLFGVIVSFGQSKSKKKKLKREHFVASSIVFKIGKPDEIIIESMGNQGSITNHLWTETSNFVIGANYRRQKENGRYFEIGIDEFYCDIKSKGSIITIYGSTNNEPTRGLKTLDAKIKSRYELGKIKKFENSERCSWGLGAAIQPFVIFNRTTPLTSQGFPTNRFSFGAELKPVAQFQYSLNEKIGISIKWLPRFIALQQVFFKIQNERLTRKQQKKQEFIAEFDVSRHAMLIQMYLKLKGKKRR